MVNTLNVANAFPSTVVQSSTEFWYIRPSIQSLTETQAQQRFRQAGTIANLFINISANSLVSNTTFKSRKNTADGNLTISITASTTGKFEDLVHSDTIAAGDDYCYSTVTPAGISTLDIATMCSTFAATTDTVSRFNTSSFVTQTTASQTAFYMLEGLNENVNTTETNQKIRMRKAGTLKNLSINIITNSRATASTAKTRKNAADGAQSASITGNTTGWFEDTTHSDTVAAGDDFDLATVTGTGVGSLRAISITTSFVSTAGDGANFAGWDNVGTFGTSATQFWALSSTMDPFTGTESFQQVKIHDSITFSELEAFVVTNSITAASTLRFRKNTANGNGAVSITASTTGLFNDVVNTDSTVDGDLVCLALTTGGTGTTLKMGWTGVFSNIAVVAAAGGGAGQGGPNYRSLGVIGSQTVIAMGGGANMLGTRKIG